MNYFKKKIHGSLINMNEAKELNLPIRRAASIKCEYEGCRSLFTNRGSRNVHFKRFHSGEVARFACAQCVRKFKTSWELSQHRKSVHEKGRDFKCTHCQSAFNRREHLKMHVDRVHLNKREIVCQEIDCGARFYLPSQYANHFRSIHAAAAAAEGAQNRKIFKNRIYHILCAEGLMRLHNQTSFSRADDDNVSTTTTNQQQVDFEVYTDRCLFLIEVDEYQHRDRSLQSEQSRMMHIIAALTCKPSSSSSLPLVWVRYNPNGFRVNGISHKVSRQNREMQLIHTLRTFVPTRPTTILYFYYDCVTMGDGSRMVPSILLNQDYNEILAKLVDPPVVDGQRNLVLSLFPVLDATAKHNSVSDEEKSEIFDDESDAE